MPKGAPLHTALFNADLAPVTPEARSWSTWNIAALWIGMLVNVPSYMLAAALVKQGLSWWQALLALLLGGLVLLVPLILIGHLGTRYGVPFPVLVRSSFGTVGAQFAALARATAACGWFGIATWIGGFAVYELLGSMGWIDIANDTHVSFLGITWMEFACFLAFWALNLAIIIKGIDCVRWLASWSAPFLLVMGLALLTWALFKVPNAATLFDQPSRFETNYDFWRVFVPSVTAVVGGWSTLSLNIPDFTRYCREQRQQAWGQVLGVPTTMVLFGLISIVVTEATVILYGQPIWNPTKLAPRLGSEVVIVISLVALVVATLSTNIAANVVSPSNDFSNLWPQRISFKAGGIITACIGVFIMPWYLVNNLSTYIYTWLIGYSALLGPLAGVIISDYYLVRRQKLDLEAMYDPDGPLQGTNWRAMGVVAVSVLPNLPGFFNAATKTTFFPAFFDVIYGYAWFLGLILAFVLYWVVSGGRPRDGRPSGDG